IVKKASGTSNVMKVAACSRVKANSMPTLMNMFRRIFVFITVFSFLFPSFVLLVVCPFTEVLQEIRRDITRKNVELLVIGSEKAVLELQPIHLYHSSCSANSATALHTAPKRALPRNGWFWT